MDDISALLKLVDLGVIAAIIGITEGIKRVMPEEYWRSTPAVPLLLGVVAGATMTPELSAWRVVAKSALIYGGAASLAYELGRTTLFGKGSKAGDI